jgi:hypothetical protein
MATKNEQFITQMKLRELSIQRDRLSRAYNELDQQVQREAVETGRLRLLSEGLRGITFAEQRLHPDIANMEPLFEATEGEPISAETISFWHERLEKERASGLLRSEIMYIFGALLEEWTAAPFSKDPESEQIHIELVERLLQPATTGNYTVLLDSLIADLAFSDENERVEQFQKAVGNTLRQPVSVQDLVIILEPLSTNPYHSTYLCKQAQSFLADPTMQKELADALTIMLEHLDEWQRPQNGIRTHVRWAFGKWRLDIDEDLPTSCLLEILGQRWQSILQLFFRAERQTRFQQFAHWDVAQLLSRISQGLRPGTPGEIDIWNTAERTNLSIEDHLKRVDPLSIAQHRLQMKSDLKNPKGFSGYSGQSRQSRYSRQSIQNTQSTASQMEQALMLINAEIALAQTLPSAPPLYILKIDFKDYYPGLSHQVLLDILQRYGASPAQLAFFQTFLQTPLLHQEKVVTSACGIPNYYQLSHTLGELVAGLFEHYVERHARVQIVRLIDDICILGTSADEMDKAWQAIGNFCEAFGLALNQEKCGSICVGGERLALLPPAQPAWLLLTLDSQGDWHVNWGAFDRYLQQARQHVMKSSSLISQIKIYNAHLRKLVKTLAMRTDLGNSHRQEIATAMERFSQSFFGPGQSIIAFTYQSIYGRILKQASTIQIPEAWLYWPMTAGGCGLLQATILATGFNRSVREARETPEAAPTGEPPDDWQYRNNDWSTFYRSLLQEFEESSPVTSQVMETLVNDFIQRGSEVSNRYQPSLSPYWRWIVYIYGPQILDSLGTFRFLITELVPLQLIVKKYHDDEQ